MLNGDVRPSTLEGVKRLATQFRKQRGIKHAIALDLAARAAECTNFRHAQRILPLRGRGFPRPYVLLTVYWRDKDSYGQGRETLEVVLSKPILDLCSKTVLKELRGFGWMRMVARDHFVCDELAQSQESARARICTAVRALRFTEHTGLLPSREYRKAHAGGSSGSELPDNDHASNWTDPATGQFIVVDEPYSGVPDEAARGAWAAQHGWRVAKTLWPGMYYPYSCDLYVATDCNHGYDLDALVAKINALPAPLVVADWSGESSPSHDVFCSPAATTPQDRRRAKSRGTIFPERSSTTIPYRMMFGIRDRRPVGAPGVEAHIEMGRVIKAVLFSTARPHSVYRRMDSLRSTLEDWMGHEIGRDELQGSEFFDVYYHEEEGDPAYAKIAQSRAGLINLLRELRTKLASVYPDCAPLRRQLHRVDMSMLLIGKMKAERG